MTSPSSLRPAHHASGPVHCFELGGFGTTPAARITLRTPATKPSNKNTIIPHAEIPSQRSISQPTAAPTRTPATSSAESRKPRAIADGAAGEGGPGEGGEETAGVTVR